MAKKNNLINNIIPILKNKENILIIEKKLLHKKFYIYK